MELFRRIFVAAMLAGIVAGAGYAVLQQWRVVPLILEAETYEVGDAHVHEDALPEHSHDEGMSEAEHAAAHETEAVEAEGHHHDEDAWAPSDGFERVFYTSLATILAALGFALVLGAVSVISGLPITLKNGALWGVGGFATVALAPAFGLPPELPGMPAGDLVARQVWWWGTAIATGLSILAIAKYRQWPVVLGAIVVIALPHILGAPQPAGHDSDVPAGLASAYAATALGTAFVFWVSLGGLFGLFNETFGTEKAA